MESHFNVCRLVWNIGLEVTIRAREAGIRVDRYELQKQLVGMKKDNPWMYEANAQSLQSSLINLDSAYKSFYKGGGFPKFKSRKSKNSFQCPGNIRKLNWEASLLSIPKIPDIPIKLSRRFEGVIKTVTITKTPTSKYYASILVYSECHVLIKPPIIEDTTVGVDLGIKHFLTTSAGTKIDNPKHLGNNLKRLKCLHRRASRKNKGSSNRDKANKRVALKYESVSNMRNDFLHKITTKLIRDSQANTFCVESLNVKGMIKNSVFALSILDVGWSEFLSQMKYKCEWHGKNFIEIGRFEPSSKTCSKCGSINETLTLADREWACASCLTVHDRDLNAAINIKNFGLKKHSGMGSPGEPMELRRLRRAEK